MKINIDNFEEFKNTIAPCYLDENGNVIFILRLEEDQSWLVARTSREGDIEQIESFVNSNVAEKVLQILAIKNHWEKFEADPNFTPSNKLGYSFNWLKLKGKD
jgi:hypothetical protein